MSNKGRQPTSAKDASQNLQEARMSDDLMKRMRYTEVELARIAELYHMHWSLQQIADDIGRSRHSVVTQLDKMRSADPTFKRRFRAKEPTPDSLRRRFGAGMGAVHTEMKKLTIDARVWLHEEAAKQGYVSVAEMVVDHFMEHYNERT